MAAITVHLDRDTAESLESLGREHGSLAGRATRMVSPGRRTGAVAGPDVIVAHGHVPLTLTDDDEETEAVVVMRDPGHPVREVVARPVALLSIDRDEAWQAPVLCVAENLQAAATESASLGQVQAVLDEAYEAYLRFTGCPD